MGDARSADAANRRQAYMQSEEREKDLSRLAELRGELKALEQRRVHPLTLEDLDAALCELKLYRSKVLGLEQKTRGLFA